MPDGGFWVEHVDFSTAHDVAAIYAVLQAGLCYLVLRSTVLQSYSGVSLRSASGWRRFEAAIDAVLDAVFK